MFDGKIVLSIKEQMLTGIAVLVVHASEPYFLEKAIHNMNSASSEENSIIQAGIISAAKGTPIDFFFPLSSFTCLTTSFGYIICFTALNASCLHMLPKTTNMKQFII